MQAGVFQLLADAGMPVRETARGYRPVIRLPQVEAKILKPQNAIQMLHCGSRDLGFAGRDWVVERGAKLVEVLDTELDPVRIVLAAPRSLIRNGELDATGLDRPLRIASEYEQMTNDWIDAHAIDARFVRAFGATEVFPPEDADAIVDNTSTGATLRANGLTIVQELAQSTTRLYACPASMEDDGKRARIETFALLLRSVLEARKRVMLEVNVAAVDLERVVAALPCMREPTVSRLHSQGVDLAASGYAVKAAVPRDDLPKLIPTLQSLGGTDLVVTALNQLVP